MIRRSIYSIRKQDIETVLPSPLQLPMNLQSYIHVPSSLYSAYHFPNGASLPAFLPATTNTGDKWQTPNLRSAYDASRPRLTAATQTRVLTPRAHGAVTPPLSVPVSGGPLRPVASLQGAMTTGGCHHLPDQPAITPPFRSASLRPVGSNKCHIDTLSSSRSITSSGAETASKESSCSDSNCSFRVRPDAEWRAHPQRSRTGNQQVKESVRPSDVPEEKEGVVSSEEEDDPGDSLITSCSVSSTSSSSSEGATSHSERYHRHRPHRSSSYAPDCQRAATAAAGHLHRGGFSGRLKRHRATTTMSSSSAFQTRKGGQSIMFNHGGRVLMRSRAPLLRRHERAMRRRHTTSGSSKREKDSPVEPNVDVSKTVMEALSTLFRSLLEETLSQPAGTMPQDSFTGSGPEGGLMSTASSTAQDSSSQAPQADALLKGAGLNTGTSEYDVTTKAVVQPLIQLFVSLQNDRRRFLEEVICLKRQLAQFKEGAALMQQASDANCGVKQEAGSQYEDPSTSSSGTTNTDVLLSSKQEDPSSTLSESTNQTSALSESPNQNASASPSDPSLTKSSCSSSSVTVHEPAIGGECDRSMEAPDADPPSPELPLNSRVSSSTSEETSTSKTGSSAEQSSDPPRRRFSIEKSGELELDAVPRREESAKPVESVMECCSDPSEDKSMSSSSPPASPSTVQSSPEEREVPSTNGESRPPTNASSGSSIGGGPQQAKLSSAECSSCLDWLDSSTSSVEACCNPHCAPASGCCEASPPCCAESSSPVEDDSACSSVDASEAGDDHEAQPPSLSPVKYNRPNKEQTTNEQDDVGSTVTQEFTSSIHSSSAGSPPPTLYCNPYQRTPPKPSSPPLAPDNSVLSMLDIRRASPETSTKLMGPNTKFANGSSGSPGSTELSTTHSLSASVSPKQDTITALDSPPTATLPIDSEKTKVPHHYDVYKRIKARYNPWPASSEDGSVAEENEVPSLKSGSLRLFDEATRRANQSIGISPSKKFVQHSDDEDFPPNQPMLGGRRIILDSDVSDDDGQCYSDARRQTPNFGSTPSVSSSPTEKNAKMDRFDPRQLLQLKGRLQAFCANASVVDDCAETRKARERRLRVEIDKLRNQVVSLRGQVDRDARFLSGGDNNNNNSGNDSPSSLNQNSSITSSEADRASFDETPDPKFTPLYRCPNSVMKQSDLRSDNKAHPTSLGVFQLRPPLVPKPDCSSSSSSCSVASSCSSSADKSHPAPPPASTRHGHRLVSR
eukprot:Blabericola_migrator_1__13033@NODE_874_length_6201_cov_13_179328_g618_i0_p1_GENE_NODE_874_length_6201_cov_13_179328_g618_i0NODE_874_length_6201_cov_13_179328_g618_i0_p1_ORF_typecomplete_len1243_score163_49MbeD_MobD/PF04899_12/1_7e04MbeD_MobD/PF04899_12/0_099_NODE_874_length_6201_cov_13_179328_g618_i02293957